MEGTGRKRKFFSRSSFFLTDLATLDGETKCDVARLAAQKLLFHFFLARLAFVV